MDVESRMCVFFTTVTFLLTLLWQQQEQLLEVRHSGAAVLQEKKRSWRRSCCPGCWCCADLQHQFNSCHLLGLSPQVSLKHSLLPRCWSWNKPLVIWSCEGVGVEHFCCRWKWRGFWFQQGYGGGNVLWKSWKEWCNLVCDLIIWGRDELVDVASAGKSESKLFWNPDEVHDSYFQLSLLVRSRYGKLSR